MKNAIINTGHDAQMAADKYDEEVARRPENLLKTIATEASRIKLAIKIISGEIVVEDCFAQFGAAPVDPSVEQIATIKQSLEIIGRCLEILR